MSRAALPWSVLVVVGLASTPIDSSAQALRGSVTGGLYVDPGRSEPDARLAPTVLLEGAVSLGRRWSLLLDVGYARSDFAVGPDELHAHIGTALVGLQFDLWTGSASGALVLGGGALVVDDVSETDAAFASGARWQGTLTPGISLGYEIGDGLVVVLLIRDHLTGMFDALFDPAEGNVRQHLTFTAGVRFE